MSGWVPMDAQWWPSIAESLPKPWSREAVLMDLRWWSDQEKMGHSRRPGRPALAARWGWTDWATKNVLKSEDEWGDPSIPPADRQRTASRPPAGRQSTKGQTPTNEQNPPADRQDSTSAPPADRPTRVGSTLHPTPTPISPAAAGGRAEQVAECMALQERDEPQHGMNQPRDRQAIERAIARGRSLVELGTLWDWSGLSADPDAEACRRGGWRRWGSLLKAPLGDERIAAALAWDAAGRSTTTRATGPPSTAGPTDFIALARQLATPGGP